MTTFHTVCPNDGSVDLQAPDVLLTVPLPEDRDPFYVFLCPRCGSHVEKRADGRIVTLLIAAGAEVAYVAQLIARAYDDHEIFRFVQAWSRGEEA